MTVLHMIGRKSCFANWARLIRSVKKWAQNTGRIKSAPVSEPWLKISSIVFLVVDIADIEGLNIDFTDCVWSLSLACSVTRRNTSCSVVMLMLKLWIWSSSERLSNIRKRPEKLDESGDGIWNDISIPASLKIFAVGIVVIITSIITWQ